MKGLVLQRVDDELVHLAFDFLEQVLNQVVHQGSGKRHLLHGHNQILPLGKADGDRYELLIFPLENNEEILLGRHLRVRVDTPDLYRDEVFVFL